VVAGGEQMAGIKSVAGARAERRRNGRENGADFLWGAADRGARSRRILDQEAGAAGDVLERPGHRTSDALDGGIPVAGGGGTRVEADRARAERRGALELLRQAGAGALPLLFVGGGRVE